MIYKGAILVKIARNTLKTLLLSILPICLFAQQGKVGINTQHPTETLDVNGKIRIRQGAQQGYILTADSLGAAYWSSPPSSYTPHGTICITELGAVGDGMFDNTSIIQKAIDSVGIAGGKVCIPAGIYKTTGTLTLPAGVLMEGTGTGSTLTGTPYNGSVIKYAGNGCLLIIKGSGSGVKELTLYDDNNSGATGGVIIDADGTIIESCHFNNVLLSGFTGGTALTLHAHNNGGITYCTFNDLRIRHAKTGIHLVQDSGSFVNSNYFIHGAVSGGGFDYCLLVEGGDNNNFNGLVMEPYKSLKGHLVVMQGNITGNGIRIEGISQSPSTPVIEFKPGTYGSHLDGLYGGGLTIDGGNNDIQLLSGKGIGVTNPGSNLFMNAAFNGYSNNLLPDWNLSGSGIISMLPPDLFPGKNVIQLTVPAGSLCVLKPEAGSLPAVMTDARYDHCNFGYFIKTDKAGIVTVTFNAPAGMATSSFHPGDNSWHFTGMSATVDRSQPISPCLRIDNSGSSSDITVYVTAPAFCFGNTTPVIESGAITSEGGIISGMLSTSIRTVPAASLLILPKDANVFIITGWCTVTRINHLTADRFPKGTVITLLFDNASVVLQVNPYLLLKGPFTSVANSSITIVSMGDGTWRELQRNL
jgi:hypothetical protein